MKLSDILNPDLICTELTSSQKMEVLAELGSLFCVGDRTLNSEVVTGVLVERERLATTGVGEGIAIPHAKSDKIEEIRIAVGISRAGIQFDAVDGQPVHIFFAMLAPQRSSGDHLRALAQISRLLKDPGIRSRLMNARTAEQLLETVRAEDGKY